jgi:hypothetical protein
MKRHVAVVVSLDLQGTRVARWQIHRSNKNWLGWVRKAEKNSTAYKSTAYSRSYAKQIRKITISSSKLRLFKQKGKKLPTPERSNKASFGTKVPKPETDHDRFCEMSRIVRTMRRRPRNKTR